MTRYDLLHLPLVRPLLRSRWPQLAAITVTLASFGGAIISGFVGTPVGSRSFGIVFVWIVWWALLMLVLVPFGGRAWCSICPIPVPGEWLQRGALLGPKGKGLGLGLRWPNRLRNIWLQNAAFVLVALFSLVVLTQPGVTAVVLTAFVFIAVGVSMVFERRAFCRYLCPVGGFIGLYAQFAPLEVRVKDRQVCAAHTEKSCYTGSAEGYGCPWQVYAGGLAKNTYCGTCMECLRTCPHDNIALNLRPFGADLLQAAGRKLDEAFKAFIMLGSAIAYSAVMLGPWGGLKAAAYSVGTLPWLGYVMLFLVIVTVALPGSFWLAIRLGNFPSVPASARRAFIAFAYSLVPLGLAAWMAFSLSFVFANLSYVWPAISDPLGRGWNLLGLTNTAWAPYLMSIVPWLQTAVLLAGLVWSSSVALSIARERGAEAPLRQIVPVVGYQLMITLILLGLLVG